ncbi:MAG: thermonuclease family protein [Desulfovibrio sp.]|jgi:micrococcal nuclease|nr:thermonuclease family protein [Desulfovibrio sp.]
MRIVRSVFRVPAFFSLLAFFSFCLAADGVLAGQGNAPSTPAPRAKNASGAEGVVAHCFDGDTVKLTDRRVVRLAGIDAPEMPHEGAKAQYYAREARRELVRLAQGQKIRLVAVEKGEGKDAHGRAVADLRLGDGRSLSELMVGGGMAFFYPHQGLDADFQRRLLNLQKKAIAEKRGLWARLLSLPLALRNYTGNHASMRFFPADCPEAQRIKPRNKVYFGTLMDAFLAGYAPARICLFWPLVP